VNELLIEAKKRPGDADVQHNLGVAFFEEHTLDDAILWLKRALAQDSTRARTHLALASAYLLDEKYREAFDEGKTAAGMLPELSASHLFWGEAALALGDAQTAIRELTTAVKLDPTSVEARSRLAAAYGASGQVESARETERGAKMPPPPG
jgi:Tfp pilus assembly protein PilF